MIEFLKDWQGYRAGVATDALPGGVADALRCRGIVRDVQPAVQPKQPAARSNRSNRR